MTRLSTHRNRRRPSELICFRSTISAEQVQDLLHRELVLLLHVAAVECCRRDRCFFFLQFEDSAQDKQDPGKRDERLPCLTNQSKVYRSPILNRVIYRDFVDLDILSLSESMSAIKSLHLDSFGSGSSCARTG